MTNNFEQIKTLLRFDEPEHFYFLQILKRRKDNPDMKKDVSVIDNFFIYQREDLDKLQDKIIKLCDSNNARACIRLNVRDAEKIALQTLKITTDCILNKDYKGVKSAYLSACGQYASDKNKKWIVDIDTKDDSIIVEVINHLLSIPNMLIYAKVPTKNGFHILVNPFNPKIFSDKYPTIDLHKDNPTILYIP
jgi:hypothetical protein